MGDDAPTPEVESMRTKVVLSVTVRPDIKAKIRKAVKADGGQVSPIVEALIENYLEVREMDRMEKQKDPLGLRA